MKDSVAALNVVCAVVEEAHSQVTSLIAIRRDQSRKIEIHNVDFHEQ
jgi:hypothetical protein